MGVYSIDKNDLKSKIMNLKSLFLFAFISCIFTGFGQSYSNNREKFVKEFQKILSDYGNGDYQDFVKKELPVLLLEGSTFPPDYFSRMIETCNLMETKRLKAYPDIYNYIFSVSAFVINKQPKESYDAWHDGVDKLLDNRNLKRFGDFIELSAGFFSESRISESPNFAWFYIGGTYKFEFDIKTSISFSGGNLVCRAMSRSGSNKGEVIDSLNIIKTTGEYDPMLKKWVGVGGKITWEKVGLPGDKTFALLNNYSTSMKNSTVNIDTVSLTTPYFNYPIKGICADRAFKINREEDKIYPQFLSFEKRLLIAEIVPDVDYSGGFSMEGSSFVGAGTSEKPAMITYKKNGVPFVTAKSKIMYVTPKKVMSQNAKVVMYVGEKDSLSHSSVNFLYDLEKENIEIVRVKSGGGDAPFEDSFHQLDIFVPKITWKVGSDDVYFTFDFGTSQEQKVASFESKAYFDSQVYDRLQGMSPVHPLVALFRYAYKFDEMVMTEGKAASALGLTIEQAKGQLLQLSSAGFINYDSEGGMVAVNKKLITFVKAKSGDIDFDNIVFKCDFRTKELKGYSPEQIKENAYLQSIVALYDKQNEERRLKKEFGILNLPTMDLDLEAVDNVVVSSARNFIIFPENSHVKVKENRDFNFSGWINAGKMELNTKASRFKYNDYKVEILSTHESLFRVRPLKKEDGVNSIPMVSKISGIAGEILIDDTTNRAGAKPGFEKYPYLKSTMSSKVFYNSKNIYGGVYDSTRFYYTIAPFELDSLNSFKEAALRLKGELTSAGIFPKIKEDLKIMPDYSFGFSMDTPKGGLDFYDPSAKYDNAIALSNYGLQGSGTIDFIHSTSISKSFSFLPDSTVGIAQFTNKGIETGIEFPAVEADEAYVVYVPKQKLLKAKSVPKKTLSFFEGQAQLKGTAYVQEDGMTGSGMMTFATATLISNIFEYKNQDILSDTASFNLRNDNSDLTEAPLAFQTDDVNVHIDFVERKGEFHSNKGESVVFFPVNEYMCKMDNFTWWMDSYNIDMERQKDRDLAIDAGVDLKGANFFSLNDKQDSLQFRAPRAKFNTKEKIIHCQKVEYLDIADARIFPDSMELYIRKKARMDPLENSKIVANYITKYHQFENATVQVLARRKYEAKADYAYYDQDSLKSLIPMKSISLDTAYQTIAEGVIDADYGFKLSEHFDFYGKFSIEASKPSVLFNGATRINHECVKFDRNWMSFTTEIDPTNIQIPVSEQMKDLNGAPISAGIVWRNSPIVDSLEMYPTFLSALTSADDPIVITASGFLQYNDISKEYQIGSKEKLVNRGEKGNYLALHTESCSLNGDGVINLGMNYGETKMDAVGVVNYNQTTGKTTMNVSLKYTAEIDKGIFQNAAKRIQEVEGLQPMAFNSSTLEQAIVEWDSREAAEETKSKFTIDGAIKKVPSGLSKSIVFTGVRLESFADKLNNRGLISSVESAVIVNLFGEPVMKYVPFKAFFQQVYGDEGDQFSIMTDIPGNFNYFYNYAMTKKDGVLRIITNDTEFNTELSAIKEEKLKSKNFKYEASTQTVYMNKLLELFNQ